MKTIITGLFCIGIEVLGWYYLFGEKNYLFASVCLLSAIAIKISAGKEEE